MATFIPQIHTETVLYQTNGRLHDVLWGKIVLPLDVSRSNNLSIRSETYVRHLGAKVPKYRPPKDEQC